MFLGGLCVCGFIGDFGQTSVWVFVELVCYGSQELDLLESFERTVVSDIDERWSLMIDFLNKLLYVP